MLDLNEVMFTVYSRRVYSIVALKEVLTLLTIKFQKAERKKKKHFTKKKAPKNQTVLVHETFFNPPKPPVVHLPKRKTERCKSLVSTIHNRTIILYFLVFFSQEKSFTSHILSTSVNLLFHWVNFAYVWSDGYFS